MKILITALLLFLFCSSLYALRDPTRPIYYHAQVASHASSKGLTAIWFSKQRKIAVIGGEFVGVGTLTAVGKVIAIHKNNVTLLQKNGKKYKLELIKTIRQEQ